MDIKIRYNTIDRFSETRRFKTLAGARRYARRRMGDMFDISETFGYVVSGDGVGKLEMDGITPHDLMNVQPVTMRDLPAPRVIENPDEWEVDAMMAERERWEDENG